MRFIHTRCRGEIDPKRRMCKKCKKRWNLVSFMLTSEIRPMTDKKGRLVMEESRPTTYAKWADRVGAGWFASKLPNWPRWARILATAAFIAVLVIVWRYLL